MSDTPLSPDLARATDKARLRRLCLEARDRIGAAERQSAAIAVLRHLPELPAGAAITGYWPIRSEFDPRPVMDYLDSHGHPLALPVVAADRQTLVFRRYRPGMQLERAAFGLSVPPETAGEIDPDVLIVPLAGFDRAGHRLGYGAGHYDRALSRLFAVRSRFTLGLAFAAQEVDAVPAEPHDMRLDAILTERGLIVTNGDGPACG